VACIDQEVDEGELLSLIVATFDDVGTLDTHTATIDWDDGTALETGVVDQNDGTVSGSHVYADNGFYTVTVTVTDDDAASTSATFDVTVNNVTPTLAPLVDQPSVLEGDFITLGPGTFSDPGFDNSLNVGGETEESFTATIDWGDGTIEPAVDITLVETNGSAGTPTTGTIDATHAYADNGTYTVTVTVFDDDGGSDSNIFQVTVANVSPTLTVADNQIVDEGILLSITNIGTFTDPGFDNPLNSGETEESFTYSINWGDVTPPDTGIPSWTSGSKGVLTTGSFDGSHTYADDGLYTVTVIVNDDDGGIDTQTFLVTVENVAPAVSVNIPEQTVQYSDSIQDVIITATDVPADIMNAIVSWNNPGTIPLSLGLPDEGTIDGGLSLIGDPNQVGTGNWILTGVADLAPDTYIIRVTIYDEDGGLTDVDITINVLDEDAAITYNGPGFVSIPSIRDSVAVVELRAIIQDITAVDPVSDPDSGNITTAKVTFVNRDNGDIIAADIPVDLLNSDIMTGIVSYEWVVDIGSSDSETFTIGIIVDGYYSRDSAFDNTLITVSKPIENSVTGGGYIVNEYSAGVFAGDTELKTNFGFNVKFNKRLTNLQGHVNIIIRQGDRVYQLKTNAMRSLVVDPETNEAIFISKANLVDITDPNNPISIAGNLSLLISLTDRGDSPTTDSIGITLWNRNELWFSSNWAGTETIEQLLAGGNFVIHGHRK
jgi:PKD repeat protein